MFRRRIFWIVVVLLCVAGAWFAQRRGSRSSTAPAVQADVSTGAAQISPSPVAANAIPTRAQLTARLEKLRLSNTAEPHKTLIHRDSAVLLENARWDATLPLALNIPSHLKTQDNPGTYIVKARGHIDEAFLALLRRAGLTLAFYVPNDAWVVRGTEAQIAAVTGQRNVQAVIPWEPYFKLRSILLPLAVDQMPVPAGTYLNVVLFADQRDETVRELETLGSVLAEGPSPFGPVITMQPNPGSLVALAQLRGVQLVELTGPRVPANDLARVKLGISPNTITTNNYFGLTGTNILVAMTDSGVDMTHPDLISRVVTNSILSGTDTDGHGTHVAAIIAGNGASSATVTNAPGSVLGANFRGKAPGAKLYSMVLGEAPVGNLAFDAYAQQQAAATNALIWNNSWAEGGVYDYDIIAASYDASVRDAQPFLQGSQPVLPVFAASGRDGELRTYPSSGRASGSINSPGTGKNVLTIGGLEQLRNITNKVVIGTSTNAPWVTQTDSSSEVAGSSGRGNVGLGVEGPFGRFKPDLVAPSEWVLSARSAQWDTNAYYNVTNVDSRQFNGLVLRAGALNQYGVSVPLNAVGLRITAFATNVPSPLPIYIRLGDQPTLTQFDFTKTNIISLPPDLALTPGGQYFYAIQSPTNVTVRFNLRVEIYSINPLAETSTNTLSYYHVLRGLNDAVGPFYRYEAGTSMAAPAISGMLALMQEFYEQRMGRTNSPALMKALLINGARSASLQYDLKVLQSRNDQGWGLANLPTSLPSNTNAIAPGAPQSFIFVDQNATNALATGQSQTRSVVLTNPGIGRPLRVTLVWTDPPGNPSVGVKLVNDLDLVVTNLDTGEVFHGNDILGGDFNSPTDTNSVPTIDSVNNVENVFLAPPLSTNYSVTVIGHRVNVNAVTAQTNGISQDYALVISSGNGEVTNAFAFTESAVSSVGVDSRNLTTVTGAPVGANPNDPVVSFLAGQHVGANHPMIVSTNGTTNQWHFYVVTNTTTFSNAAFAVFSPLDLSVPRIGVRADPTGEATRPEADIDLYISTLPGLTNLDPAVLLTADRSVTRGGTEFIIYSNSTPNLVYYIGVKSEDQMAADYIFFSAFSPDPFLSDGTLRGYPIEIPDGSPEQPAGTNIVMFCTGNFTVRRVVITNTIAHENFGDLFINLGHAGTNITLLNHTYGNGQSPQTLVYDDTGETDLVGTRHSDGPGSLQDFLGMTAAGLWLLTVTDNAPTQTGRVISVTGKVDKQDVLGGGDNFCIGPSSWFIDSVVVPVNSATLTVTLTNTSATPLPLELYLRRGAIPNFTDFDKKATINPPSGSLSISKFDLPPLNPGTYYIGVYNPNNGEQCGGVRARIDPDTTGILPVTYTSTNPVTLIDDAVTMDGIYVNSTQRVVSVEVGVAIRHPRISDLALQLVGPSGKRVLLFENRGGLDTNGLGGITITTNVFPATTSGGAAANTNTIASGNQGTLVVNHTFFQVPDQMHVYYDGVLIYDTGLIPSTNQTFNVNFGPGISTNIVIIMNEGGNANTNTAWEYTATIIQRLGNYFTFTEDTNKNPTVLKFTPPPFGSGVASSVFFSGFEGAALGDYPAPTAGVPDGWSVITNSVNVSTNAPHSGTNVLALQLGTISRTVATVPGHRYTLSYAYRTANLNPTHWWPGNSNTVDIIAGDNGTLVGGANATSPGEVAQSFNFDGTSGYMQVGSTFPFHTTNDSTFEFWMNTPATKVPYETVFWTKTAVTPDNNRFNFFVASGATFSMDYRTPGGVLHAIINAVPITRNAWTHLAITKSGITYTLYTNGVFAVAANDPAAPQLPTSVGWRFSGQMIGSHEYAGNLDEVATFDRVLTPAEIKAIYVAGAAGKCGTPTPPNICGLPMVQVSLVGLSTNVLAASNPGWLVTNRTFTATGNSTTLQFQGLQSGMFLDSIQLLDNGLVPYVFPEESLAAFAGDVAKGIWNLEVWDSRVGGVLTNPPPELTSWQLSFIFENTQPAPIPLEHGVAITNTVAPGQMQVLVVDVPAWATAATNTLLFADFPLLVWFNQTVSPASTNPPGTQFYGGAVTNGVQTLITNGVPPLLPGQRYYIGIQNTNATNVTYSFRVDFDITALTNGVPYAGTTTPNGVPRYFTYAVSSNATAVAFDLFGMTGNLNLVARQGAPLPDLLNYDYGSFNFGLNDEQILVLTNSSPVALRPGVWYLGVFNTTVSAVNYTIRATELTNTIPTIITLTNATPYTVASNNAAPGAMDYYRYVVTPTAARAQFETFDATGDFTIVAHKSLPLPDLTTFDYLSANAGTNNELIVILTNSAPVTLTPGDWFITAVKISSGPAAYSIMATEWNLTGQPIIITNITGSGGNFCITWNSLPGVHYVVQRTPILNPTTWTDASPTITAVGYTTTYCVPITGTMSYFRVIEGNSSATAAAPSVIISSIRVTPGGVVLNWFGPVNSTFHVQWANALPATPWNTFVAPVTSTNGIFTFTDDGSQSGGLGPLRFYRLVSP